MGRPDRSRKDLAVEVFDQRLDERIGGDGRLGFALASLTFGLCHGVGGARTRLANLEAQLHRRLEIIRQRLAQAVDGGPLRERPGGHA